MTIIIKPFDPDEAIARAIIEAHGGGIAVHSDGIGHGAQVTFRLPLPD